MEHVCLFELELSCFNELKRLLILNLITLLPPSRLLAFTLIVIYRSSTLCFLINHLVIDIILFCTHLCPCSQKSCLFSELLYKVIIWSEQGFHSFSMCYTTTCVWKWNSPVFWELGNSRYLCETELTHS